MFSCVFLHFVPSGLNDKIHGTICKKHARRQGLGNRLFMACYVQAFFRQYLPPDYLVRSQCGIFCGPNPMSCFTIFVIGSVYVSQSLKFVAPVFVGSYITARIEVVDVRLRGSLIKCKTVCYSHGFEEPGAIKIGSCFLVELSQSILLILLVSSEQIYDLIDKRSRRSGRAGR